MIPILLTEEGTGKPVYVNPERVLFFSPAAEATVLTFEFSAGSRVNFRVRENVAQVVGLMRNNERKRRGTLPC